MNVSSGSSDYDFVKSGTENDGAFHGNTASHRKHCYLFGWLVFNGTFSFSTNRLYGRFKYVVWGQGQMHTIKKQKIHTVQTDL